MPGELNLQITLIRDAVNANAPTLQLVYALLEATPTGASVANVQMPLNLSLVLDRSGSMNGPKIQNLRQAVKMLIDQLQPTDFISIVLFDDQVEIPVYGQPAADKTRLHSIVDTIEDRGGTQMSLGLQKGLEEISRNYDASRINKIVLLTDGNTWGDEPQCQAHAQQAAQYRVPIVALGLGLPQPIAAPGLPQPAGASDDWNQMLLDGIAQMSGGTSDLIETPDKIVPVFQRVVRSAQASVIRNAELVLRLSADVTARQVWQVVPLIQNLSARAISLREAQVTLGDIEKNIGKSVLVELALPPKPAGKARVAQAEVSYDVPFAQLVGEKVRVDVVVEYGVESALNPRVANLAEKVNAHKLQTRALQDAQAGNIAGATQKLKQAATQLLNLGETQLAQAAMQEAQNLQQQGQMSAAGTKRLSYGTRKLTQALDERLPVFLQRTPVVPSQPVSPPIPAMPPATQAKESVLSLFAIARVDLGGQNHAFVGKDYSIQAGIAQETPERFEGAPFDLITRDVSRPIPFDIVVHVGENVELTTEWHKELLYYPLNPAPQLVDFGFRVTRSGHSIVAVDFYHERRWLKTVRLEFESVDVPAVMTVSN